MTIFNEPLQALRSLFNHVEVENHLVNLANDSRRRWVGFSCAGSNHEYLTWACPAETIVSRNPRDYDGEDGWLLCLMSDQKGRIAIIQAVNHHIQQRLNYERLRANLIVKPGTSDLEQMQLLESILMQEEAEVNLLVEYEQRIWEALTKSFRTNIPSRYERKPVI